MNDICMITAFFDINRDKWSNFNTSRSADDYIRAFSVYLNYDFNMIIYIDDRYYDQLNELIKKSKYPNTKILKPINNSWMIKNIWTWSRLDREKEIMHSDEYRSLVADRISAGYPENTKPEYTIITHSKIDFVNHAINNLCDKFKYYMWVDFGYFLNKNNGIYLPNKNIDIKKLNPNTVNLCCILPIDERDRDILYTLKISPEKIGAYLFAGNADVMLEFQKMCHECLEYYQSINIADDEQSHWLQCFFKKPELFTTHVFYRWHAALKAFSK